MAEVTVTLVYVSWSNGHLYRCKTCVPGSRTLVAAWGARAPGCLVRLRGAYAAYQLLSVCAQVQQPLIALLGSMVLALPAQLLSVCAQVQQPLIALLGSLILPTLLSVCAGAAVPDCFVRLHGSGPASSASVCLCTGAAAPDCLVRLHGAGPASSASVCLCTGAAALACLVRLHGFGPASSASVCLCAGAAALDCLVRLHGSGPASSASVPAPVPVPAHPLRGQGQHGGRCPCSTNPGENKT